MVYGDAARACAPRQAHRRIKRTFGDSVASLHVPAKLHIWIPLRGKTVFFTVPAADGRQLDNITRHFRNEGSPL